MQLGKNAYLRNTIDLLLEQRSPWRRWWAAPERPQQSQWWGQFQAPVVLF